MPGDAVKNEWRVRVTPPDGEAAIVTVPHGSSDPRADAVKAFNAQTGQSLTADELRTEFANG